MDDTFIAETTTTETTPTEPANSAETPEINPEPSLVEILAYYAQAGFDSDAFTAADGMLLCGSCSSLLAPDHIDVHSIRRLEGQSDPSDMVGVIAIVCPVCKAQATVVLKYGPEATPDENEIWQRTNDARDNYHLPPNSAPGEEDMNVTPEIPASP